MNEKKVVVDDFSALAKEIIENVGGKENVMALEHCMTRLRFSLKDNSKANKQLLEKMEGTVGVAIGGGQFQVIIGTHVPKVFAEVSKIIDISSNVSLNQKMKNDKPSVGVRIQRFMEAVMFPILGVLAAAGIVTGLLALFRETGLIERESGFHIIFQALGDTVLHYFPIFVGFTTAKYLKMSPLIGLALGAALVHPSIAGLPEGTTFFGIDIGGLRFTNTFLPVMFMVIIAAPLERWLNKVTPEAIKMFAVPLGVLVVIFPLGVTLIGPGSELIITGLNRALAWLFDVNVLITMVLISFSWQFLIVFGIHRAVIALMLAQRQYVGMGVGLELPVAFNAVVFAQTAVVFAIWLKTKDMKLRNASLPTWITGIFGITEPAIFGVTLPRIKFFLISCIAAAVGGLYFGIMGVQNYQPAGLGIFAIFGQISPDGDFSSAINWVIGILLMMAVGFITTIILFKDEKAKSVNAADSMI